MIFQQGRKGKQWLKVKQRKKVGQGHKVQQWMKVWQSINLNGKQKLNC